MQNLTLKQLRYFEALTLHGHFGRAADVCAISQPALSMQIKRRANMTPIWEGRASVTEAAGTEAASMSATIRPLSAALLKDFPGTSGATVRVPQ